MAIKKVLTDEKGAAVIIWASFMLILTSMFAALLLETGDLLLRKHAVQAAADAAALSGASAGNIVFNKNPGTMEVMEEVPVIDTDSSGGGVARQYADELLDINLSRLDFEKKRIVIADVDVDGDGAPEPGVKYISYLPVAVTDLDGTVRTYYQGYGLLLAGYLESPLWGTVFGRDRVPFRIPSSAKLNRE